MTSPSGTPIPAIELLVLFFTSYLLKFTRNEMAIDPSSGLFLTKSHAIEEIYKTFN